MAIKVGINGFGRIGRQVLRIALSNKDIEVVAINDIADLKTCSQLLKYDSIFGVLNADIDLLDDGISIDGKKVRFFSEMSPSDIKWTDEKCDIVIESTGIFTTQEKASMHLDAGAKRVLVSAPASGVDFTVVYGVNHQKISKDHLVISNASCTTNCLAPIAMALNNGVGINQGFMTTIHSYTGDQPTLDTMHSDLYRSRAAAGNMIPTSTGAAKAVGLVLPELNGKLDGVSVRVPTQNVSVVDFKFNASRSTSVDEINNIIKESANGELKNILGFTDEPLVSSDFNHDKRSSIFHMDQTKVMDNTFVRVLSWYDNEWGFSNRMSDTAVAIGKTI